MNSGLLMTALTAISLLTSLFTAGIKKLLDEKQKQYSDNMLAVIVAFAVTVIGSIMYLVYTNTAVTAQILVIIIALVFLSFLVATVGYDKVKQMMEQLGGK